MQARFNAETIIQTQPIINILIFFWNLKFNWRPSQGGGGQGGQKMHDSMSQSVQDELQTSSIKNKM